MKGKLIWFAESGWTKYHAAIGIKAGFTVCGIMRSNRAILSREKPTKLMKCSEWFEQKGRCRRCLAALGRF